MVGVPGGGVTMSSNPRRSRMAVPEDGNVVRLGTETLFAIGDELRRMYDADLQLKPSKRLERLIRLIERGEESP